MTAEALAHRIDHLATTAPDRPAFVAAEGRTDWAEYAAVSTALAARLLRLGLGPGERVAVLLPDGADVHASYVATERAGLVAVGIGPRAGRAEIEHLLRKSGAAALVSRGRYRDLETRELFGELCSAGLPLRHHLRLLEALTLGAEIAVDGVRERLEPASPADRALLSARGLGLDDLWLLNSTSGTTGMPKCVMHHQRRWFAFHELAVRAGELDAADVFMSVVPAPFGFGLWTAHFTPALLGAPVVLAERFQAEAVIAAIERERVSVLAAVSTQFILMLESEALERHDLCSLRVLFTGGERVPYERAAAFEDRTGARVLQFYGSNETGALCGTTIRDPRECRLRTAGRVLPEMQVRLFDAQGFDVTTSGRGQPGCKGPTLSLGYWQDEAANRELIRPDGWVLLGDVVSIDGEGYLRVEGRVGDFIIRGGKNLSAAEVESFAETHPAVALAAAVAMPDPIFGERVCLYVEARGAPPPTLAEIATHMESRGASKEILPEYLVVLPELPRSSGGKVAKRLLREDAAHRAAQAAAAAGAGARRGVGDPPAAGGSR